LDFIVKHCIVVYIGNENKQMWFASQKEVRRMIEIQALISTIYILYYSLIGVTIITFALIIALAIIISKQK
jgi:hypothetical protein